MGLIYFNSKDSKNNLYSEEGGEYNNIEVALPLCKAEYGHVRGLKDDHLPEGTTCHEADYVDALVVAADMVIQLTDKKKYCEKRIVMATDLSNPKNINENGLEDIIERFKTAQIILDILYFTTDLIFRVSLH